MTKSDRDLVFYLLGVIGFMVLFSSLSPWLYRVICQKTGLDGKALRAYENEQYAVDMHRTLEMEFLANPDKRRKIDFYPSTSYLPIHPGEIYTLYYHLVNKSDRSYVLQAIPSMAPPLASSYIRKLECFCFQPQPLGPYEHRILPLKIVMNPTLPDYIQTISLSYALFELDERSQKESL